MAHGPTRLDSGRSWRSIALGLVLYVAIGTLAYWLFYSYYDEHGVGSSTTFKVNFTLVVLGHLVATLASSAIAGRVLGASAAPVLIGVAVGVAVLLLPTLSVLALVNDCLGVSFPWDGGCPH